MVATELGSTDREASALNTNEHSYTSTLPGRGRLGLTAFEVN